MTADDWYAALVWGVVVLSAAIAVAAVADWLDRRDNRRKQQADERLRRKLRRRQAWELVQALDNEETSA